MKKSALLVLLLGMALSMPGCGYDPAIDSSVMVVRVTPTPEPTPTPETTPEPEATPEPTPEVTEPKTEQTPSGIKVEVKEGTYYTTADVNLRGDASPDGEYLNGASAGTELKSTGVCENGWVRVEYEGQTCYVSGDFVTTEPAA